MKPGSAAVPPLRETGVRITGGAVFARRAETDAVQPGRGAADGDVENVAGRALAAVVLFHADVYGEGEAREGAGGGRRRGPLEVLGLRGELGIGRAGRTADLRGHVVVP